MDSLSAVLRGIIEKDKDFKESLNVIRPFVEGKLWVVGGYVYRNLVYQLYDIPPLKTDIDFLAEHVREAEKIDGYCHGEWIKEGKRFKKVLQKEGQVDHVCGKVGECDMRTSYSSTGGYGGGSYSYCKNKGTQLRGIVSTVMQEVDLFSLQNLHSIERRNLDAYVEHYLTGVPFTIQSIAYDLEKKELVGDVGIKALETKTIGINNFEEAIVYVKEKGTIQSVIEKKAGELRFKAVLPRCMCAPCILNMRVQEQVRHASS